MPQKRVVKNYDLEILLDNHPNAMVLSDTNGIILAINSKLAAVFGKPKDEIIGTSGFSQIGTHVIEPRKIIMEKVVRTKKPAIFEDKDRERWWRTEVIPILDEKGTVIKLGIYIEDISVYKEHEKKSLSKQKEYYSALVENSNDLITVVNNNSIISYLSPSVVKILGFKPEEMIGRSILDFIHPDDLVDINEDFTEFFRKRVEIGTLVEYRFKHKNGNWIFCESTINDQLDNPNIKGIVFVGRDISVTKKELKEKEMLIKEIHHRVKNNLQLIHSLLDLQSDRIDDKQVLETLKESKDRIMLIASFYEQLYQSENVGEINFREYIQNILTDLFQAHKTDSNISFKIDVEDFILDFDTALTCGFIISELVTNSLKHAFPDTRKGEISISFKREVNSYKLEINDSGIGISTDINLNKPKSLGLNLVKIFVKELKGNINLDGANGTRFIVIIPQHRKKHS
jgi:PAS domain S-box-containing protein